MLAGSQKFHCGHAVGMERKEANPEPDRVSESLLHSTIKEMLSS